MQVKVEGKRLIFHSFSTKTFINIHCPLKAMISAETIGMIVLLVVLSVLLWMNRSKVTFSRFAIFYAAMYRTKRGLATMDNLARKYKWIWMKLTIPIIVIGFLGMGLVVFDLVRGAIMLFTSAAPPSVGVVLPFKAKGVFYVPFYQYFYNLNHS